MTQSNNNAAPPLSLRQSIAPKVLDNSLPMATIVSTDHFSVRVADPNGAHCTSASNVLTTFLWRDPGAKVFLSGSFDDWRKHQMMYVPDVKYHILVTELPPGDYFYRFVVDGRWRVAEDDPNLKKDEFGQLSHFISINSHSAAAATSKRFSSAAVARAHLPSDDAVLDKGDSDTESERSFSDVEDAPLPLDAGTEDKKSVRVSRKRGSTYIGDYDDDAYAGFDLQADVFEAMKDVAEVNSSPAPRDPSPSRSFSTVQDSTSRRRIRQRPGMRVLRKVWGMLFGEAVSADENVPPNTDGTENVEIRPTQNQKAHGLVTHENALKKGLKVWFPNERNFPSKSNAGRKVAPSETRDVIDAGDRALKLHQVEENANNRQMLGKNLFAQGKFDAALALFSLSVKLREDNGLKYAKTTAIAHTDVASAFIHLEDLKNAEKHLNKALGIFNKGTFSGGKAQLGDVHCFLGVIGDMRGNLKSGETAYRAALDLYEKCKSTDGNPNYATAIENLNANIRRQRALGSEYIQPVSNSKNVSKLPVKSPVRSNNEVPAIHQASSPRRKPTRPQPPRSAPKDDSMTKPQPPAQPPSPSKPLETPRSPPSNLDKKPREFAQPESNGHVQQPHNVSEAKKIDTKPSTWKGLAETARKSMPECPPEEKPESFDDKESPAGPYEEMCRMWHKDARNLLGQGKYKEAIDLYTLTIYTRKRHGPWSTTQNVETLVEFARASFATQNLEEAIKSLKDAISILENMSKAGDGVQLGELWGNLGSVLDRVSGRQDEALSAHCAGMVAYGKSGMSSEDQKWKKAWKGLCLHLKKTDRMDKAQEIWHSIDLQIRGVKPMTKIDNVVIR